MARKPVVSREEVLRMLQEGRSTQVVAEHFGVSRQAIDLHRRDFIQRGLLTNERAARRPRTTPAAAARTTSAPAPQAPATDRRQAPPAAPPTTVSLDDLIELVIRAVSALRRLPELEAELNMSRREHSKALEELDRLRTDTQRRQDQELRWRLVQNGQQPAPPSA